jgi:hypothetical protein
MCRRKLVLGTFVHLSLRGFVNTAGLNALMHYKRLTKERKDALELASRQNWQLMQVEQERKRSVCVHSCVHIRIC